MHEFQLSLGFLKLIFIIKASLILTSVSEQLLISVVDLTSFKAHSRDF